MKAYAESVGRANNYQTVHNERLAAEVVEAVDIDVYDGPFYPLVEIHPAPRWLWSALVSAMVADSLTVDATRNLVAKVKDISDPPAWSNVEARRGGGLW